MIVDYYFVDLYCWLFDVDVECLVLFVVGGLIIVEVEVVVDVVDVV